MEQITEYERERVIEHKDELANFLMNNKEGSLYYKIFANMFEKAWPNEWKKFNESMLKNKQDMANNIKAIIEYMAIKAAEEKKSIRFYTTGQIAKYFGVSLTSVNNWINENRFTDVNKVARKQARIPENSMWRSSSGELISVKEVVELWEKQYAGTQKLSKEKEKELIGNDIKVFEDKYGSYEALKIKENKTNDDIYNQKEWEYLLKRYLE